MKIAITSSSQYNPFVATLIHELSNKADLVGVICTEKPRTFYTRLFSFFKFIRHKGIKLATKRVVKKIQYQNTTIKKYTYLEKYAKSKGIKDWDLMLLDLCNKKNMDCIFTNNINAPKIIEYIKEKEVDLLINAGGGIFKNKIINAPRLGILNNHMASLPNFRGMNVLEWSIFYNREIGITAHFIDRGVDTGDIVMFRKLSLETGDKIATLRAKVQPLYILNILECVSLLTQGKLNRVSQRLEDGKQYFVMHSRLKQFIEQKLSNLNST